MNCAVLTALRFFAPCLQVFEDNSVGVRVLFPLYLPLFEAIVVKCVSCPRAFLFEKFG